jgi:hypothetical protein
MEDNAMKKLAFALALAAVLGFALSGTTALAKEKIKDVTCDQYLAMDPVQQSNVVYWLDGVDTASSGKHVAAEDIEVGYDGWGDPVAALVTECTGDKKASLWSKIKAKFHHKKK